MKAKVLYDGNDSEGSPYWIGDMVSVYADSFRKFRLVTFTADNKPIMGGIIQSSDIEVIGLNDAGQRYVGGAD